MSIQPAATVDDLTLAALDFNHTPQCEHSSHRATHTAPAWAFIRRDRTLCKPEPRLMYLCRRCWDIAGAIGIVCSICGVERWCRDEIWTLLGLVGSE